MAKLRTAQGRRCAPASSAPQQIARMATPHTGPDHTVPAGLHPTLQERGWIGMPNAPLSSLPYAEAVASAQASRGSIPRS